MSSDKYFGLIQQKPTHHFSIILEPITIAEAPTLSAVSVEVQVAPDTAVLGRNIEQTRMGEMGSTAVRQKGLLRLRILTVLLQVL